VFRCRFSCAVFVLLVAACSSGGGSGGGGGDAAGKLRLWHTFSPRETEALNEYLAGYPAPVEPTLLPFSRAQRIVAETLAAGEDCPDLVRIDATWLPGLAREKRIASIPKSVAARDWLPEAAELARYRTIDYGMPQAIDGLALLYDPERVAAAGVSWPPQSIGDLLAIAHRLTIDGKYGLSVRVDGYWFVAFLRAWGGDVLDPAARTLGVDQPIAATALTRFAALFATGGVAPPPAAPDEAAPTTARRFRDGDVAIVVDGPWAVADLRSGDRELGVAAFPNDPVGRPAAPFGGQLFVVPKCARDPDAAWALARALTDPALQAQWSARLGLVPTTEDGLARAGAFAQSFREALLHARPLPRHAAATEMFDDLTPAVAAVVAGDATADEALAGVARAWTRLIARQEAPAP
jgi:arabinogalactan oligomer/maltooligosaccharide transport system substrate-binding protein